MAHVTFIHGIANIMNAFLRNAHDYLFDVGYGLAQPAFCRARREVPGL